MTELIAVTLGHFWMFALGLALGVGMFWFALKKGWLAEPPSVLEQTNAFWNMMGATALWELNRELLAMCKTLEQEFGDDLGHHAN